MSGESNRRKPPKEAIAFEKMVIACAEGLIARGEQLSHKDKARLWLAIERVQRFL